MLEFEQVVKTALGTGNTMDNFLFPTRHSLFGQIGVGNEAAAHGHHVAHVIGNQFAGHFGIIDPMTGDHRDCNLLFNLPGHVRKYTTGNAGDDLRHPGFLPADINRQSVY